METLLKQYQIVRHETNTSHVMQFGDMVCYINLSLNYMTQDDDIVM